MCIDYQVLTFCRKQEKLVARQNTVKPRGTVLPTHFAKEITLMYKLLVTEYVELCESK